jgi:hypothetical protein
MTTSSKRTFLHSERQALRELLQATSEDNLLERIGLEARLTQVDQEIAELDGTGGTVFAETDLVFHGAPVHGSEGIDARFASNVLGAYQDLLSKTLAGMHHPSLKASGPIPDAHLSRVHITGIARGSFGFELRELADQETFEPTPLFQAAEKAGRLVQAAGSDDESFLDAVEGLNPRVHEALRSFLQVIRDAGATFRIQTSQLQAEFSTETVMAAVERAAAERKEEEDVPMPGRFLGVLHGSRTFEHEVGGEVIKGKADPELELSELVSWDLKQCVAHVRVLKWTRAGKEYRRYTLLKISA